MRAGETCFSLIKLMIANAFITIERQLSAILLIPFKCRADRCNDMHKKKINFKILQWKNDHVSDMIGNVTEIYFLTKNQLNKRCCGRGRDEETYQVRSANEMWMIKTKTPINETFRFHFFTLNWKWLICISICQWFACKHKICRQNNCPAAAYGACKRAVLQRNKPLQKTAKYHSELFDYLIMFSTELDEVSR